MMPSHTAHTDAPSLLPRTGHDLRANLRTVRICLAIFIAGLVLSGATAFPLVHETGWLTALATRIAPASAFAAWVIRVHAALLRTAASAPFLAYGTDWLAFAHLVLALAFVGPWRDPVRNCWVLQFGLMACASVVPLALIAGPLRGIPLFWRLGDCCFGMCGALPLWVALQATNRLTRCSQGTSD